MRQSDNLTTVPARDFADELALWGPDAPSAGCSLLDAQRYCSQLAKSHYENFTVVSFLIPRKLRQDFHNIYAYCRWSDDLADEINSATESVRHLDWWQRELDACYQDELEPHHPVLIALQETTKEHQIPQAPFADLLTAFRQDQVTNRYRDERSLINYCRNSANPVGRILLHLARSTDATCIALSDEICTGLQLANFCQDMSRDAAIGRIYAPQTMWARHNVQEQEILSAQPTEALCHMLREWCGNARDHLIRGWPLVNLVPRWLAVDVDLFVRGGLEILNLIERADFDVWTARPSVSKTRKLLLLVRSLTSRKRFATTDGNLPGSPTPREEASHG